MIFRLSQKLAAKLKVSPKVCAPLDANPFADWSAHLFTADCVQYGPVHKFCNIDIDSL